MNDGRLLFGSELKSLFVYDGLPGTIEPRSVEDYFALGYVPEPRTIFKDVFKLAPGHTLRIRRGDTRLQPRQYWDVDFSPNGVTDEKDACEQMIERLEEAIRIRMIADVPLGAFLSGGVDSSAVVALMAGLNNGPVNTCSISFGDLCGTDQQPSRRNYSHCRQDHQRKWSRY